MFKYFFFVLFLIQVLRAEEDPKYVKYSAECAQQFAITDEELKTLYDGEVPEKNLCYMKCVDEKMGLLRPDGTVDPNEMDNCPILKKLDASARQNLLNCVNTLKPVKTCSDLRPFLDCYKQNTKM